MAGNAPTERFSDRVEAYIRYRPDYPAPVIQLFKDECLLSATSRVAELGSDTGILTKHLLSTGAQVHALEPNAEMRHAAESRFASLSNFHSSGNSAEKTGLPDASIDLIVAAQAFHWFDWETCQKDF